MAESTPIPLTRDEARWLSVAAQRLDRRPHVRIRRDRSLLLDTIRAIGCIQLDSISVISRTHETVLWSRVGPYDVAELNALHYPDAALFEYWVHAAALAPVEHYPYLRRRMAFFRERDGWRQENRELMDRVLDRVREHGPVSSRDFERPEGPAPSSWTWYGGKPEREALDYLVGGGELLVLKRDGFQRSYDLPERVLPECHNGAVPTSEELRRWFVSNAMSALGVGTIAWVTDYFRAGTGHVPSKEVAVELRALAAEGAIVPVIIDGIKEATWIGHKEVALLAELRGGKRRPTLTTLLSPFDSLIWHRGRTSDLFGFDYRIEVYTPAPKRRYGYYNLAILHRGKLIGRLDPSYDRKARILTIRALHLEPGVRPTDALAIAVAWSLHDLLHFLKGQDIGILISDPPEFAPMVQFAIETHVYSPTGPDRP